MKEATILAVGISIILIIMFIMIHLSVTKQQEPKPQTIQAQKFRFGEQCPDGLRVEYVSTIRLPKSVICQKEIGD